MIALIRKGFRNVVDYNENHLEYSFSEDQIYNVLQNGTQSIIWGFAGSLNLNQHSEFWNQMTELTKLIDFPRDMNSYALIDYEVKIDEIWYFGRST